MMEQIKEWLILTTFFFMLFFLAVLLLERHRKNIRAFLTRNNWLSSTFPWDTPFKIFCLWAYILFSRKLLYYVPCFGIIQTKDAIWCMDKYIFFFLFGLLIFFSIFYKKINSEIEKEDSFFITTLFILSVVLWIVPDIIYASLNGQIGYTGILIILKPFLLLKMVCSGKYMGLLVSGVLAYYWIEGRKKFTIKKTAAKFFIVTGLLLILGVMSYDCFTQEWEKKSYLEWHSAKRSQNIRAFEDLIDAAHLKKDNIMKFRALNAIAEITRERGDIKYSGEMFQQAVDIGKNIQDKQARYNVLKEIVASALWRRDIKETKELLQQSINAFQTTSAPEKFEVLKIIVRAIARPGAGHIYKDLFQQAILAAKSIKDFKEKSLALNEMAVLVAEPGNIKQSELILQQAVDTADKIKDNKKRFDTLNKMAEENKKWAETIFLHAVLAANRLEDIKEKSDILTGIAKTMAGAGDSQWSDALFQKALDTAKSIEDNRKKAAAFSFIALGMTAAGNKKKGEHIFQQAIDAAEEIYDEYKRFHVFIQIAAAMLETGNIKQAREIFQQQLNKAYDTWPDWSLIEALKKTLRAIKKSKNIEWAEDIFLDVVAAVELMDNMSDDNRVKLLRKIVRLIGEKGDIEYFRKVYLWVIDATGTIEYPLFQNTLYKEIALAIAKGGDRQWAEAIAMKIPDYEKNLKKSTLKKIREIQQKIEKK